MVEVEEPAGKNSTSVSVEVLVTRAGCDVSGGMRVRMAEHTSIVGLDDGDEASHEGGDEGGQTHVDSRSAMVER